MLNKFIYDVMNNTAYCITLFNKNAYMNRYEYELLMKEWEELETLYPDQQILYIQTKNGPLDEDGSLIVIDNNGKIIKTKLLIVS